MKLCGDDGGAGGSEVGSKAFPKDMWQRFPTLDDGIFNYLPLLARVN
jgi:hypothetical protein